MYVSILDFVTDAPAVLVVAINNFFADEEMTLGDMIKNIKNQTDDLARRITSNTKKTEDVVEPILNHACDSSYRISGEDATYTNDLVSKQTVMNVLLHQEIPDAIGKTGKRHRLVNRVCFRPLG